MGLEWSASGIFVNSLDTEALRGYFNADVAVTPQHENQSVDCRSEAIDDELPKRNISEIITGLLQVG